MTATNWAEIEDGVVVNVIWADEAFISELPDGDKYVKVPESVGANVGAGYSAASGFDVPEYEYGDDESNTEFEARLAEFERRKK